MSMSAPLKTSSMTRPNPARLPLAFGDTRDRVQAGESRRAPSGVWSRLVVGVHVDPCGCGGALLFGRASKFSGARWAWRRLLYGTLRSRG